MFLQERQLQFKKAALKAKQNGDTELAKKYLRMAKGFDQMIEASQSGLPVDMAQVRSMVLYATMMCLNVGTMYVLD